MKRAVTSSSAQRLCGRVLMLTLAAFGSAAWALDGDSGRGRSVFANRCAACHSVAGRNGVGPSLDQVFGRIAGKAEGFRFSPRMAAMDAPWDARSLEEFLADPTRVAPGTSMVVNVPSPQDRADLIAYLQTLSAKP